MWRFAATPRGGFERADERDRQVDVVRELSHPNDLDERACFREFRTEPRHRRRLSSEFSDLRDAVDRLVGEHRHPRSVRSERRSPTASAATGCSWYSRNGCRLMRSITSTVRS